MAEIRDVEIGYVTTRRGARLHLVVAGGQAYCKSGPGVIIQHRSARSDDTSHMCKKCRPALRTKIVDVINIRERRSAPGADLHRNTANAAIIKSCVDLLDGLMTPEERAEQDRLLAGIHQNMIEAAAVPTSHMGTPTESNDTLTLF
jgi:hypothetical protein